MFDKVCLVSTIDKLGKAWIWCFYLLDLLECGQVASVWYAFTFQKVQCTWILGCVCFGWKWLQEIIFPQIQAFGSDGKFHFPENSFLLIEIFTFDPKMIFHPRFQFNSFPEREREREREREKREPRSERERKKRLRRRPQTELQSDDRTVPIVDCAAHRSRRSSIMPLDLVARSYLRSRLHHSISSSPPPRDLNLTEFDEFFCWVLFLLWMSVELIHYLHVYSWGSVWKIGHVKHFL